MLRLPDDYSRCYGEGCSQKESCRRYQTIQRDDAYDMEFGGRLRSYTISLKPQDEEFCGEFIQD